MLLIFSSLLASQTVTPEPDPETGPVFSPLLVALQGFGFPLSFMAVAVQGFVVDGMAPPVALPVPPDYKTIAAQIFSGQRTGAMNQIYARIARRR